MNTAQTSKLVVGVILSLFILSVIGLVNFYRYNQSLKADLRTQRARSSSLLTQKSLRERHVEKLKKEVAVLSHQKSDIEKTLAGVTADFEEQEEEFRKMQQANLSLKEYKLKGESLETINKELERNLDDVGIQLADVRAKNQLLDETVAGLEKRNSELSAELYRTKWFAVTPHGLEGLRKNKDKVTVLARSTRRLRTTLEVPVNVKDVTFVVKGPQGEVLNDAFGLVSVTESEISHGALASLAPQYGGEGSRTIEMVFAPNGRMPAGLYTIEIMAEGNFVGSLKTRLR